MEKKETVILFRGQIESLLSLSSLKDVKTILRAIQQYGMDNENPEIPEHLAFGWQWFKSSIDAHREQYEAKCDKNRSSAQKRWNKSMQTDANGCECMQMDANDADKDNDNDNNKSVCLNTRAQCADDAVKIANLYPKAKIGNWKQVVMAVSDAIQREFDRGNSANDASALVELGTRAYAKAVNAGRIQKRYIHQAVKFFEDGIYNNDPETWEFPEKNNNGKGMKNEGSYGRYIPQNL